MDLRTAVNGRRIRPHWLPQPGVLDSIPAGRWWDAIAIDGPLGIAVAEQLVRNTGDDTGPIARDPLGPRPRTYFLVLTGTADRWCEPGTVPLGEGCYVVLNGTLDADREAVHWVVRPRLPELLVPQRQLRAALSAARVRPGAERWLVSRETHPGVAREAWSQGRTATLRLGNPFEAIHLPAKLVEGRIHGIKDRAAIERRFRAAGIGGAVIVSRSHDRYSVLVPPGTAEHWATPGTECLGREHPFGYLSVPPPHRVEPPGAYWLLDPPENENGLCDPPRVRMLIRDDVRHT
ncbi:hypothetical protein [Streptomyces orinoci]|uniref:Uncharacterized protein n=1 Tax=Streptomyces orinoci TaxID=67339 RepID=A0ABV3JSY3_STRON|nr:hypothetical protein [Streptomyces orinoci]